jgi:hypothetical protein
MKDLNNLRKYSKGNSPFLACLCIGIAWLVFAVFEGIFGELGDAIRDGFAGQIFIMISIYFKHLDISKLLLEEIDKLKEDKNQQTKKNPPR